MSDICLEEYDWPALREQMVRDQLVARGIGDQRVLAAMETLPREEFVPWHLRRYAYDDCPLPIGYGQTISQPLTVAFMTAALRLAGDERVLEVGTGSGYGAAVLAQLAREVHTIERVPELAEQAARRLRRMRYNHVVVHTGDGALGLPQFQPFDAISVTAGAPDTPTELIAQLAEGGRMVIPVGPAGGSQEMMLYQKLDGRVKTTALGTFCFVPLIHSKR